MKKSFLLTAMIAAIVFVISGCSSSEGTMKKTEPIPQLYYAGEDTVISSQQFTLSPFTKEYCGKIVKGRYWNPTGFKSDSLQLQGKQVSSDSLKKWFGDPDPLKDLNDKNNASFNGMPKWFQDLIWILLALMLIGIAIALLIWAFRSARESGQRSHFIATGAPGTQEASSKTESSKSSSISHVAHTASFGKEDYDGAISIIQALKKGRTGGTVSFNNALEIHIPSEHDLSIGLPEGTSINSINVEINSGGNAYGDMASAHSGDDLRQYSRQSGGQKEKPSDKKEEGDQGNIH